MVADQANTEHILWCDIMYLKAGSLTDHYGLCKFITEQGDREGSQGDITLFKFWMNWRNDIRFNKHITEIPPVQATFSSKYSS